MTHLRKEIREERKRLLDNLKFASRFVRMGLTASAEVEITQMLPRIKALRKAMYEEQTEK